MERGLGLGAERMRTEEEWMGREVQHPGLCKRGKKVEVEDDVNSLPEKAAQVFNPSVTVLHSSSAPTSPREGEAFWDVDAEKSRLLVSQGTPPDGYYHDWPVEDGSSKCKEMHQHFIFLSFGLQPLFLSVSVFLFALLSLVHSATVALLK